MVRANAPGSVHSLAPHSILLESPLIFRVESSDRDSSRALGSHCCCLASLYFLLTRVLRGVRLSCLLLVVLTSSLRPVEASGRRNSAKSLAS